MTTPVTHNSFLRLLLVPGVAAAVCNCCFLRIIFIFAFLCRRFRFNYYALKALEARLQLYLGDETKAYELAMEVINAKTETGNALLTLGGEADFAQRNFALPSECLLALNKSDLSNLDNSLYMTEGGVDEIFEGQQAEHNRKGALWQKTLVNSEERMLLQKYRQPDASEMVGD